MLGIVYINKHTHRIAKNDREHQLSVVFLFGRTHQGEWLSYDDKDELSTGGTSCLDYMFIIKFRSLGC